MTFVPWRAPTAAVAAVAVVATAVPALPATAGTSRAFGSAIAPEQPPAGSPVEGDFDGDGRDDIFWYGPGGNPDHQWYGRANQQFGGRASAIRGVYQPISGDFDGDRRSDIFWYGAGGRPDVVHFGTAAHGFAGKDITVDGTYTPVTGDFDGDGRDDIFWYGRGPAFDVVWYGAGDRTFAGERISVSRVYEPMVGDFDGDGRDDIFWYGRGPAFDVVWYGAGDRTFAGERISMSRVYEPMVGDFDGDGVSDIFWYGPGTASDVIHYGTAGRGFAGSAVAADRTYRPVVGDFDGDTRSDVFWWAPGTADDLVWFATTGRHFTARPTTIDLAYPRPPPLQPQSLVEAYDPYGYIAHAGGGYAGRLYTNTRDAVLHNYDRGFRVFELDFVVLADGTVLAAHEGLESHYGLTGPFSEATWADLRDTRFDHRFTIMRSDEVVEVLREHPDMYVIVDTKQRHDYIFRRFVSQTGGSHSLMDRVMPHIRDQAELDRYRNTWPLRNYMLALYRTQSAGEFDDPEVVQFVRDNRAPGVMMWWRERDSRLTLAQNHHAGRRFTPTFARQIQAAGAVAAGHSISNEAYVPRFASLGVGIYSDGPFGLDRSAAAITPTGRSHVPP